MLNTHSMALPSKHGAAAASDSPAAGAVKDQGHWGCVLPAWCWHGDLGGSAHPRNMSLRADPYTHTTLTPGRLISDLRTPKPPQTGCTLS